MGGHLCRGSIGQVPNADRTVLRATGQRLTEFRMAPTESPYGTFVSPVDNGGLNPLGCCGWSLPTSPSSGFGSCSSSSCSSSSSSSSSPSSSYSSHSSSSSSSAAAPSCLAGGAAGAVAFVSASPSSPRTNCANTRSFGILDLRGGLDQGENADPQVRGANSQPCSVVVVSDIVNIVRPDQRRQGRLAIEGEHGLLLQRQTINQ
mmetsp:Transcript_60133/g.127392  ORF Transcript_60133/g.127392 Transcript_60133/m.127392 type:complete len:204 (-) Transcript_60133:96-707(-)